MVSQKTRGLLSREDSAAYLSVSPRTFDRLVAKGEIPRRRIGCTVRFAVRDLDVFIESLPDEPGRSPRAERN